MNKEGEKVTITDGPFAETREVLAGFYVFQCDTTGQAIAYAERIPPIAFSASRALLLENQDLA